MNTIDLIAQYLDTPLLEALDTHELKIINDLSRTNTSFDEWFQNDPNKLDNNRVLIQEFDTNPSVVKTDALEFFEMMSIMGGGDKVDFVRGIIIKGGKALKIMKVLRSAKKGNERNPFLIGFCKHHNIKVSKFLEVLEGFLGASQNTSVARLGAGMLRHLTRSGDFEPVLAALAQGFLDLLDDIESDFINRKTTGAIKGQYAIIISKDPIDIARMSEGRGWESCTDIKRFYKTVYEVAGGGFVAYVVKRNYVIDPEQGIKNPTARLWVRKFIRVDTQTKEVSIKVQAENAIYGTDTTGRLQDLVSNWIRSKGQIDFDIEGYALQGSDYSDSSFSGSRSVAINMPTDHNSRLASHYPVLDFRANCLSVSVYPTGRPMEHYDIFNQFTGECREQINTLADSVDAVNSMERQLDPEGNLTNTNPRTRAPGSPRPCAGMVLRGAYGGLLQRDHAELTKILEYGKGRIRARHMPLSVASLFDNIDKYARDELISLMLKLSVDINTASRCKEEYLLSPEVYDFTNPIQQMLLTYPWNRYKNAKVIFSLGEAYKTGQADDLVSIQSAEDRLQKLLQLNAPPKIIENDKKLIAKMKTLAKAAGVVVGKLCYFVIENGQITKTDGSAFTNRIIQLIYNY